MTFAYNIRAALVAALAGFLCAPLVAQNSGSMPLVDPKQANAPRSNAPTAKPQPNQPLLPLTFAGWQRQDDRTGKDPAQVDAANAAVMKEYGFSDFEQAAYTREARKISIKAARFADAGGAFGAFTFYRQPDSLPQTIGDAAATQGQRVLFYRGNILVEASLDQVTAMSAAELRELASSLPPATGAARNLPSLPSYLPKQSLVANSTRYFVGPIASATVGVPLATVQMRFDEGAEVVSATYNTAAGPAELVLMSYPTPQLAAERQRSLEQDIAKATQQVESPGSTGGATSNQQSLAKLAVRRSGPIVAVAPASAKPLLASVNYDANVTWDEPTFLGKRNNVGNLVVAALALAGIILGLALIAGLVFGGFRILMKRFYPDRFFDRSSDVEIIRLNLRG